jgi:hypothetical protein
MKKIFIFAILFLGVICFSFAGDRLSDKEVKEVIDAVDHGRDRFEDALEGKLKNAIYRGPRGEVDIGKYLDDLQENTKELQERFKSEYSASSEVRVVLEKGSNISNFMSNHPGTKGASEFDHFAVELKKLANAYGTEFPLPENAAVRRINDGEAAKTADMLAKQADQLKKQIGKDKTIPKDQQQIYKQDIEAFQKSAKTLKSRLSDSKPSTAEARAVMDQAAQIGQALEAGQLSPAVSSAWSSMQSTLNKIGQAFGQ